MRVYNLFWGFPARKMGVPQARSLDGKKNPWGKISILSNRWMIFLGGAPYDDFRKPPCGEFIVLTGDLMALHGQSSSIAGWIFPCHVADETGGDIRLMD